MRCQKCGKENEPDSKFCIFCGSEIKVELKSVRKCPKCGAMNPEQVQYCATCGSSLMQPIATVTTKPSRVAKIAVPARIPSVEQTRIASKSPLACPKCARENDSDAKFCDSCGSHLSVEKAGRICTNCGMFNTSGGIYCESCGTVMAAFDGDSDLESTLELDESETLEMNPIKEVWRPVYERYWRGSSMSSSGWIGFALFMSLVFLILLLIIAAASGSWWGAFCGAGVLFIVATLVLAFVAYSVKQPALEPEREEHAPEDWSKL